MSKREHATGDSVGSVRERARTSAQRIASGHDVIVIGASTGGVEALEYIITRLPATLGAAVFVVQHIPAAPTSMLPKILARGKLPVRHAVHGEKIEHGHVYIAPADNHMMIEGDHLRVVRGPRENGHRPAVDPLFRSAARHYGTRVIGVVLTGGRDCGSAGLLAIKAFGGIVVVQDPADAVCADMPRNALHYVEADHILPLAEIPALLTRLVRQPAGPEVVPARDFEAEETAHTRPAAPVCPACGGAMHENEANGLLRFRCHVGHAFSTEGLMGEQAYALEAALWAAQRMLEESEDFAMRMAQRSAPELARRFAEKAHDLRQHGYTIKNILLKQPGLAEIASSVVPTPGAPTAIKLKPARRAKTKRKR